MNIKLYVTCTYIKTNRFPSLPPQGEGKIPVPRKLTFLNLRQHEFYHLRQRQPKVKNGRRKINTGVEDFGVDGGLEQTEGTEDCIFGDVMRIKRKHLLRLVTGNVNTLSKQQRSQEKEKNFFINCRKYNCDVMAMQEVGLNWKKVRRDDQWVERTRVEVDMSALHSNFAFNLHDTVGGVRQWGGTSEGVIFQVSHTQINIHSTYARNLNLGLHAST
jgi:hypothetical protein